MASLSSLIGGNGWEHFGEATWRCAANTLGQTVANISGPETVTIDTEVLDTGNKLTVNGDNTFTLEAGTYSYKIFVPMGSDTDSGLGAFNLRLWNVTDSDLLGSLQHTLDSNYGMRDESFEGVFVLPSQKTLRIDVLSETTGVIGRENSHFLTMTDLVDRTRFQFKWRA